MRGGFSKQPSAWISRAGAPLRFWQSRKTPR